MTTTAHIRVCACLLGLFLLWLPAVASAQGAMGEAFGNIFAAEEPADAPEEPDDTDALPPADPEADVDQEAVEEERQELAAFLTPDSFGFDLSTFTALSEGVNAAGDVIAQRF